MFEAPINHPQRLLQVMQLMHLLQIQLVKSSHIFESGIREQYLI